MDRPMRNSGMRPNWLDWLLVVELVQVKGTTNGGSCFRDELFAPHWEIPIFYLDDIANDLSGSRTGNRLNPRNRGTLTDRFVQGNSRGLLEFVVPEFRRYSFKRFNVFDSRSFCRFNESIFRLFEISCRVISTSGSSPGINIVSSYNPTFLLSLALPSAFSIS